MDNLQPQYRTNELRADSYDDESGTLTVEFSSETPVKRFFGNEILSHDDGAVNLDRLRDGGTVLWEHDEFIGNVVDATVTNKRGVAQIRLGVAGRAAEIRQNLAGGVRPKVSVGYRIHALQEKGDDVIATRWEPFEVSLVGVGADASARIRSENSVKYEGKAMSEETQTTTMSEETRTEQTVQVLEPTGPSAMDALEIMKAGKRWGKEAEAEAFIRDGKSVQDFNQMLIDKLDKAALNPVTIEGQRDLSVDFSAREEREYSYTRGINAFIEGRPQDAPLEMEASRHLAGKIGRAAHGFLIPVSLYQRTRVTNELALRAPPMGTDKATEGEELFPIVHRGDLFIEHLYANSVVLQAGATVLSNLMGQINIPRQAGSAAQAWVDQYTGQTAVSLPTAQVVLTPHITAGAVSMSRLLLKNSNPSVEALVRSDLAMGAALALDNAALEGAGTAGEPEGIANTSGVLTQVAAGAGPTWTEAVGFETALGGANALRGSLAYVMTSAAAGFCKTTAKDAGSGLFVMEGNEINGYPVYVTNNMADQHTIFGNWNEVIVADWGVLEIQADVATLAPAGGLVLRSFLDCDIGIRHAVSFCISVAA